MGHTEGPCDPDPQASQLLNTCIYLPGTKLVQCNCAPKRVNTALLGWGSMATKSGCVKEGSCVDLGDAVPSKAWLLGNGLEGCCSLQQATEYARPMLMGEQ